LVVQDQARFQHHAESALGHDAREGGMHDAPPACVTAKRCVRALPL
jgi:hypothetical protein